MSREPALYGLLGRLANVGYGLPAYDAPLGESDPAMDAVLGDIGYLSPHGLDSLARRLDGDGRRSLYRYSVRAASRSSAIGAVTLVELALLAALLAEWYETEPRDLMVNFTPHHVAASQVEGSARRLFEWIAGKGAPDATSGTLRTFGRRTDVTLDAFGWRELPGPGMVWFALDWGAGSG